jgi:hypothetical protein
MNKKLLKESIARVEEGLKISKKNLEDVNHHIEEGNIILEALKAKV